MLIALLILLLIIFVVLPLTGYAFWLVISTAVVGLIIGGLARLVVPGRQPIGLLLTALIGVAGSLVGSIIGRAIDAGNIVTFLLQIAVATVVVALVAGGNRLRR